MSGPLLFHHCAKTWHCCSSAAPCWLCVVFSSQISHFRQSSLPDGRFRGRPPWSAPSGRTRRTPQRPAGSSAPRRCSGPSSPWRRTGVWAPPAGLKSTTHTGVSLRRKLLLSEDECLMISHHALAEAVIKHTVAWSQTVSD